MTDEADFTATLTASGLAAETLATPVSGTLQAAHRHLEVDLPALASKLTRIGPLGKGGQAVVELALQAPLSREVAVKRPVTDPAFREMARTSLIIEGRICGQLEHPNIIPIYDLGTDEHDEVVLVMKRVQGFVWNRKLKDPEVPLSFHLHVLQEVCRAVHFAHTRGVLHRDLKPGNVMIGSENEVYVLDWGLAVAIDDRAPEGVPLQTRTTDVVGSPGYMPPEMAWPGEELDPRADVFLLGSVLYRILAGRSPHQGGDLKARLVNAVEARADPLPVSTPEELVEICAKARSREREQRYPTADAFREALVAFDAHANARTLNKEGGNRLGGLRRLSATEDDDRAASRLYTEARFAFSQALKQWPESRVAHAGTQDALGVMILRELQRQRPDSAERLAHELDAPTAEVEAALAEARTARNVLEQAAARAHELDRENNATLGERARAALLVGFATLWALFQVFTAQAVREGSMSLTSADLAQSNFVLAILVAVGLALTHKKIAKNRAGRQIVVALLGGVSGIAVIWFLLARFGIGPFQGMALVHVFIAMSFFFLASQDRLWVVATFAALSSVPLLRAFPDRSLEINGAVVSIAFLSAAWPSWTGRRRAT